MLPYTRILARQYTAEIILLHVVNPVYTVPATAFSGPVFFQVPESVFKEKAEDLEKFGVDELRDLPVRRLVYEGAPESQIAEFVQGEGVQLVVMPTHGHGAFRRYLLGSVSAKVLHDVGCPVLTDAHIGTPPSAVDPKFAKIVCALDLGERSRNTLDYALKLATDFQASLSLVHVVSRHEQQSLPRTQLEELQKQSGAEAAGLHIEEGDVAHQVSSFVQSAGADLLVIGRGAHEHGSGRLRTNGYAIIRQAPCPVLSV